MPIARPSVFQTVAVRRFRRLLRHPLVQRADQPSKPALTPSRGRTTALPLAEHATSEGCGSVTARDQRQSRRGKSDQRLLSVRPVEQSEWLLYQVLVFTNRQLCRCSTSRQRQLAANDRLASSLHSRTRPLHVAAGRTSGQGGRGRFPVPAAERWHSVHDVRRLPAESEIVEVRFVLELHPFQTFAPRFCPRA